MIKQIGTWFTTTFWADHRDSFTTDKSPTTWKDIKTARLDNDQTNLKDGDRTFMSRRNVYTKLK